jgi:putative DNA primase/helicase
LSEHVNSPVRPGISSATLTRLGIRRVNEDEGFALVGQRFEGLYIPYGVRVNGQPFGRLRLDVPAADRKYTQRADTGVHPYLPDFPELNEQPDLVLVEGEFKAIALCEAGFRAIGISGFYGFMHQGKLCPRLAVHLKDFPCERFLFLGDNDTALNFQFSDAAVKLVRLVQPVPVMLPRIPWSMAKGVDDCREDLGADAFAEWWRDLVAGALEVPAKLNADLLAVELFKAAVPDMKETRGMARAFLLQKITKLASCLQPVAQAELGKLCKGAFGITPTTLKEGAKSSKLPSREPMHAKEVWLEVVREYGPAVFLSEDEAVVGLNERFWAGLIDHQNLLLHEPTEKRFFRYDEGTGLWRYNTEARLEQLTCGTVVNETDHREECIQLAHLRFAHSVVGHLKGICEKADAFGGIPSGIHVANGYLVISEDSLELQEFSPSHYSRNRSPVAFDPEARCPRFIEQVLQSALKEDDIALLQYYMGQCLLGRNLTQTILILHGPGGTGKGTISNILQEVVGVHNCQELRTDHLDERFEIFRYIGRTLLYGADVDPGFLRADGAHMLKKLVGNDLLSPEGKNSNEVFNIRGSFNVVIACNKRLSVRLAGDVTAWRRRLRIIEFHLPTKPRPVIVEFDRHLVEEEGPGILNWAIIGAAQVLADVRAKRTRALSVRQQERLDGLLGMSDSVQLFLEAKVEKRHGSCLEKNDVLEAYADYCGEQRWEPMPELVARKELNNRMLDMFGSVERKSAGAGRNQRGYSNVGFIGQGRELL